MGGKVDDRSVLVLAEPIYGPELTWHGMAFVRGKIVNDVTGVDRAAVLEDCWSALDAAGIATEFVVSVGRGSDQ